MKFSKVRNVKSPVRGTSLSAGIDFFVPKFDMEFFKDLIKKNPDKTMYKEIIDENTMSLKSIVLKPQGRILIPSGIHVNLNILEEDIPSVGVALIAHNKSGVGSKKGLDRLAEVVDEDYQGEVHISVVNTGTEDITILPDEKIIQFLLMPVFYDMPVEMDFDKLYTSKTERGDKGFGQGTGK